MRIVTARVHHFRHRAAIRRLLLVLDSQRVDVGPQRHSFWRALLPTIHHDAASLRSHPHGQPQLIEQLIQMQTGLQFFATRLWVRVQMPAQHDHLIG